MFHVRLIKYFYFALTMLVLICPVRIPLFQFVPGLILMWGLFFMFIFGTKFKFTFEKCNRDSVIVNNKSFLYLIVSILYLIFYPFYIKYYTGSSAYESILSLSKGISNYGLYQQNFQDSNLGAFSFSKLPFILGHGVLRFIFIVLVFRAISFKENTTLIEKISISFMSITIVIVGISRGTSFELFELFLIFLFAFTSKKYLRDNKERLQIKTLFKIVVIAAVLIYYFFYNINIRMGDSFDYLDLPDFDKGAYIYIISKPIALVLYSLYGYFLFGLYFNSTAILNLWITSFSGFISVLIPNGIKKIGIDNNYREFVGKIIDLGAMWNPDSSVYIDSYGIIFTLIFIFLIGKFSNIIFRKISSNLAALCLLFFIFYIFVSMPIGNFISSSSANIISIILALICYKFNLLKFKPKFSEY
jgi:hypothetical protein